ncbi:hypothetical protein ScPMuIL_014124 [Solemya velum]
MTDITLSERQNDELEVLKAIYLDGVVDLRDGDVWKVGRPPEVKMTLKPQESMGTNHMAYVQVDMIIRCPLMYPNEAPEVILENPKGLSDSQLTALKKELDNLAKQLVGEVMILELAQHIQKFLRAYNRPPSKSFYEEMMCNKRKQEEIQEREQQRKLLLLKQKEEKERQLIEDEILKRQEKLKESKKKKQLGADDCSLESSSPPADTILLSSPAENFRNRADSLGKPQKDLVSPILRRQRSVTLVSHKKEDNSRESTRSRSTPRRELGEGSHRHCKDHTGGIVVLAFNTKGDKTVHRGGCLGHGFEGSTVYVGIDTHTGQLVAISEWVMKWCHIASRGNVDKKIETDPKAAASCLKQVMSIEQELMSLLRLHHKNLVHYQAIKYQQAPGRITVYLLMDYVGGMTLDIHMKKGQPVSTEVLRQYTEEILLALDYLHSHSVVHKDLRASSIFIDMNGRIRLADYSINKRLSDMYKNLENDKPGVHFHDNRPPILGRGRKKGDIYQLGLLLLSLVQGESVIEMLPEIPKGLPPSLSDFLTKCLMKDERYRLSASELLEHNFLCEPITKVVSPHKAHLEEAPVTGVGENSEDQEEELPYIMPFETGGQSRLTSEFVVLKCLGKGGFGDVLKVRNKLDGRSYAIKRIPLNPKSKLFNKKITREVKLLSRLNHENVVRYYNSWIETSDEPAETESSSLSSDTPKNNDPAKKKGISDLLSPFYRNSLGLIDDIEQYAPQQVNSKCSSDWSEVHEPSGNEADIDVGSDSEDEELDEGDVFGTSFLMKSESTDSIIFDCSIDDFHFPALSDSGDVKLDEDETNSDTNRPDPVLKLQYLYIQMEYCEKSTLRNCIDAGLHEDMERVWRLFREIIEGLVHIHEQGMIHRDLKPVNIFLDSNDHVKIGDFGLATTDIITRNSHLDNRLQALSVTDIHDSSSHSGLAEDSNLTGQVGTALYVSPEVMVEGKNKGGYDQKVDIYSLGIILFEMIYKLLPTGMERVKVLGNLRMKEIKFPDDFDFESLDKQEQLLRMLLDHDPAKRPTSKELLQSEFIPPSQMEEAELNEILRSTISDPQSKSYRRMMDSLFAQSVRPDYDLLYETDIHKSSFSCKMSIASQFVGETIEKVFHRHGAIKVATPLFMPESEFFENMDQYVSFIDHSGRIVSLPFDLRVPFARYVCKNNIHHLKRYSIERVYRQKRVYGLLFKELIECAFDIVSSSQGSLIPDAESIVVIQEIINEFPPLQQRNYYIRINHTSLQKAILLHCGIAEDKHEDVLMAITKMKLANKASSEMDLTEFVREETRCMLMPFLEFCGTYNKVASVLRSITKTEGQASSLAKQGLHELETVINNAVAMGLKLPVSIALGLVLNIKQYCGVLYQVVFDVNSKKKRTFPNILAAGGRYDKLLRKLSHSASCSTTAVGVSLAFREVVTAVLEQEECRPQGAYDILVCTIGHKPMLKERLRIVKNLWAAGLKVDILHDTLQSLEEIQNYCKHNSISQLVILKDSDTGSVKVRSIEKVTEKKVMVYELVEFLLQRCQSNKLEQTELIQGGGRSNINVPSSHHESSQAAPQTNSTLSINYMFFIQDHAKLPSHVRRKHEAQIYAKVTSTFPWLPAKSLEVTALDVTISVLKIIVAYLDLDGDENSFETSVSAVMEKLLRHRKYLSKVVEHLFQLRFEKRCVFILLYGLKDDSIRLLT